MNIQRIIDNYTALCKVTEGRIQEEKVLMCSWKWNYKDRQRYIEEIEVEILIYGKIVKRVKIDESSKLLGVYISPTLSQKSQFEHVKRKIITVMLKLL